MGFSDRLTKFGNKTFLPEGWFWVMQSHELKVGAAKSASFFGRDLAVFRGQDGKVRGLDAYCPHMGAHLGDGIVEENSLRCLFHNWKFSEDGRCVDIPCQKSLSGIPKIRHYRMEDRFGLIWIWMGDESVRIPIPRPPELAEVDVDTSLGNPFSKNCHPNVVMINAIDAQHFNTVHKLVVDLKMQPEVQDRHAIRFHNVNHVSVRSWLTKFIDKFYAGALTYDMTYWYGHTGTVTLGPDFLHFYIMFALRPTVDGLTEGQTVLFTKKRHGFFGTIFNRVLLAATKQVGNYFAKGDTIIFSKIRFNFQTPLAVDQSIVEFAKHYESQNSATATVAPFVESRVRQQVDL